MLKPWLITKSGKAFDLSAPDQESICLDDIAHHLARTQRFNGATQVNCSVAVHSVVTSYIVPGRYALQALMHDAAEAYTGDILSPLKWMIGAPIKLIETLILNKIFNKYKIETDAKSNISVHKADLEMLRFEKENFMPGHREAWAILEGVEYPAEADTWKGFYQVDAWESHKRLFLDRARDLGLVSG